MIFEEFHPLKRLMPLISSYLCPLTLVPVGDGLAQMKLYNEGISQFNMTIKYYLDATIIQVKCFSNVHIEAAIVCSRTQQPRLAKTLEI